MGANMVTLTPSLPKLPKLKFISKIKSSYEVASNLETVYVFDWEYENISFEEEKAILQNLKNNVLNKESQYLLEEIKKKLSSYKNQDIIKKKLNEEKIVNKEDVLDKLLSSDCQCLYCTKKVKLFYKYVRDNRQWTLDRINNSLGHNNDNVEICCLKCNLKRRTTDDEKFKFTKQMRIIKTF